MEQENYDFKLKTEFTLWISKGKIKRSIEKINHCQMQLDEMHTYNLMAIEIDNLKTWLRTLKDIQSKNTSTIDLIFNRYNEFIPVFLKKKNIE